MGQEEPEPIFDTPPRRGQGQRHRWTWTRDEDGSCAVYRDGEELIILESLEAVMHWLARQVKSGEVAP